MFASVLKKAAILSVLSVAFLHSSETAEAKSFYQKVYKVQVEYWFWDSDYYYWSTYYETTDQGAANFVYWYLNNAKENGNLNAVAPNSYWKYFAVDVRLICEYRRIVIPRTTLITSGASSPGLFD